MDLNELSFTLLGAILVGCIALIVFVQGFKMPGEFYEREKIRSETKKKLMVRELEEEITKKDQVS